MANIYLKIIITYEFLTNYYLMKMKQKYLVSFNNEWYDLGAFAHKHPGGWNTLNGQENKDITSRFNSPPGHSKAAEYLMREYKVQDGNNNEEPKTAKNHVALDESMEVRIILL